MLHGERIELLLELSLFPSVVKPLVFERRALYLPILEALVILEHAASDGSHAMDVFPLVLLLFLLNYVFVREIVIPAPLRAVSLALKLA